MFLYSYHASFILWSRNKCMLEVHLMHVRNKGMYFQKHKTTKSDLQIFLVWAVWRYRVKISSPDQIIILRTRNHWITFQYQKQPLAGVLSKQIFLKNLAIFMENLLCWSLFLVNLQPSSLQLYWKKRLHHRCFPVNFANI